MNIYLISNIITGVMGLVGFVYGVVKFFKPDKPVFAKMITMAVGCMVFGGLYQIIRILTGIDITKEFQLGIIGFIGSLVFLFSANYGAIDVRADDRSRGLSRYRLIALTAPVTALAVYMIFLLFADVPLLDKLVGAAITFFTMQISYFNLKHLIMPSDGDGLLKALKPYNILALVFAVCCVAQNISLSRSSEISTLIISTVMGLVLLLLCPSVEKGVEKWTT